MRKSGAFGIFVAGANVVQNIDAGHGRGCILVHQHTQAIWENESIEVNHGVKVNSDAIVGIKLYEQFASLRCNRLNETRICFTISMNPLKCNQFSFTFLNHFLINSLTSE